MPDAFDTPLTIPAALQRATALYANELAIAENGHRVTWAELGRRVDETAAGLVALGLGRGDRVAIATENGIDWLVAYHATVRAGATGVLVYFELKQSELREQISRPASRYLIASQPVLARLETPVPGVEHVVVLGKQAGDTEGLTLDALAKLATVESRASLANRLPEPDDLAAIIYTSGTTGGAKGVMLSHRNFLTNAAAATGVLNLRRGDSVLLVLPLHHAMPFIAAAVIVPLIGAGLAIENDLRRIRDRLQEYKPTVFFGVPALYEIIYRNLVARAESEGRLEALQKWQARLRRVKQLTGVNLGPLVFSTVHKALGGRLRLLVSGGAALNPQTARDFFSLGLPLIQGWGMTEASPVVAVQPFSDRRFRFTRYYEDHVGSVGPAVPGVEVRLIDVPDKGIFTATSGEGEVVVRGPNVFRGYWQAEEATNAAIRDGWLQTGDLGRIDKDGNIYLTGRSKYIIVLDSGEKVHPDELEEKLSESDLFEDLVVTERRGRGKVQVGAVIYPALEAVRERLAASGDDLTDASVKRIVSQEVERLGGQLAAYKRVTVVELTDAPLPKTALRKVARGQLADGYEFALERWLEGELSDAGVSATR